jgi:hypothetical protein
MVITVAPVPGAGGGDTSPPGGDTTSVTAMLKVGTRMAKATKDFAAAGKHTLTLAATDDAGDGTTVKRTLKLGAR